VPFNSLFAIDTNPVLVTADGTPGSASFATSNGEGPNTIRLANGALIYLNDQDLFQIGATLRIANADGTISIVELTSTFPEGIITIDPETGDQTITTEPTTLGFENSPLEIIPYGDNGFVVVRSAGGNVIVEIYESINGTYSRIDNGLYFIRTSIGFEPTSVNEYFSFSPEIANFGIELAASPDGSINIAFTPAGVGEVPPYVEPLILIYRLPPPGTLGGEAFPYEIAALAPSPVDVPVDTFADISQSVIDLVVDADGNTYVFSEQRVRIYNGEGFDFSSSIFVQKLDPFGQPLTSLTALSFVTSSTGPESFNYGMSATILDNGNIALVWVEEQQIFFSGDNDELGLYRGQPARVLTTIIDDDTLTQIGTVQEVYTTPLDGNINLGFSTRNETGEPAYFTTPQIASTLGGGYVISWENLRGSNGSGYEPITFDIYARLFDETASPISPETLVATTTSEAFQGSEMTVYPDGRILFTWSEFEVVSGQYAGNIVRSDIQTYQRLFQGPFSADDITFTGGTVNENSAAGTAVAVATAVLTTPEAVTFSLVNNAGGRFVINPNTGAITVTPGASLNYEAATSHDIVVRITRASGAFYQETFTINLNDVNERPVVVAIPANVTFAEDTGAISFTLPQNIFADPDAGDSVEISVTGLPSWLSYNAETGVFTGTTPANFFGQISLTVRGTDTGELSASTTLVLNITPVNDAPTLGNSTATGNEDTSISGAVVGADIDGPALTYTLATGPANGSVTVNANGTYTYNPNPNFTGTDSFTVQVSDGEFTTTPATVTVTVNPVNDAPIVATLLADQSVAEDTAVNFTIPAGSFTDVDNATLTYTASGVPSWLTFNATTRSFTGTPPANFNGNVNITVSASDGNTSVSDTFTLTITAANDAPVVATALADVTSPANTAVNLTLPAGTFSDVDGDVLTLTATLANGDPLPSWLSFNAATRSFTGTPPLNSSADVAIRVTATDPSGASASSSFTLDILAPANTAPVLANSTASGDEDTAITGTLLATDTENNAITYALGTGPSNGTVTVNANGTYTYTPNANYNGTDSFTGVASDGSLNSTPATVSVTVNAVNDAPIVATLLADQSSAEDTAVSFTLPAGSFTDVDNATLTYTTSPLPSWLSFNAATRAFTGTPPANFNGSLDITVTASDGQSSASDTFTLTITPVNDAPVLANSTASGNEDTVITGTVVATDVDSTTLTYSVGTGPANGTLTLNADGSYVYTPFENYNGSDSFTVIVSDGSLSSAAATVNVTVNAVNDVVTLNRPLVDQSVAEDTAVNFTLPGNSFADADGTGITYTTSALPSWLTFNAATRAFTGTPPTNFNGSLDITVTASDGQSSASDTFTLTITPVNDAPVLANSTASGNEDTAITGSVVATDVDSTTLTYSVGTGPANGTVVVNANGTYTYSPSANYNGTDSFTIIASDGSLNSAAATVNVTVNALNDAVTLANALADQTSAEDAAINFTLPANSFADVDGTTPILTATLASGDPLPSWLSFNAATRTFAGQPPANFNGQIDVRVTASDGQTSANDVFQINITPVNDAPSITNPISDQSSPEDVAVNFTIPTGSFGDIDNSNLTLTARLSDNSPLPAWLSFNATTGSFTGTPPANFNGLVTVTVTATDTGGLSASDTFTLNITPVNDAPIDIAFPQANVAENAANGTLIGFARGDDLADIGSVLTYSLTDNAGGRFAISANGEVTVANGALLNFEDANSHTITIRVTDSSGAFYDETFTIGVNNVNEAPNSLTLASGGSVAENAANGTAVAQLAATDPDTGATLTYSLVNNAGGRFAINATTGAITVANGALLDFETATSHGIVARVTDQGGLTRDLNVTINVTDVVEGNPTNTINGTNANNTLTGTAGNDIINALGGNDTVNAGGGNDVVNGGSGRDTLNGQGGDDQLFGGTGNDNLNGGDGNDVLDGGEDDDVLDGGNGNDTLLGGSGADFLDGGAGNDTLDGGNGGDYLFGGAGNDVIFGGAGVDYLAGGSGQDTFRFTSTADSPRAGNGFLSFLGRDTILDFNPNGGPNQDIIDLSGIDANTNVAGDQAFTFIGNGAFTRVAGQLRYANNVLSGDVNGDGVADFEIQVFFDNPPRGPNPLDVTDFIL
jgi:VCBS repeat-containing protein